MIANQVAGLFGSPYTAPLGDFESIATVTASGSSNYIEFSSIPSTYKHLQIRLIGRSAVGSNFDFPNMRFNSDSGSNYSWHNLNGDGSSAGAQALANATLIFTSIVSGSSAGANIMGTDVIDILDYSNTNKYKTSRALAGVDLNGSGYVALHSGNWRSTTAISSIQLYTNSSSNWTSTSTFALYGVK